MEHILANAIGQDLSQMAAQEKQMLLSRLLERLAHEIRNPLSSLDIHLQLLEEDLAQAAPQVKKKSAGRFEVIHGELHRLETLIQQFLKLAGPSSLEVQSVHLAGVVGHVGELLRPEAAERGIELAVRVPADLPSFTADPGQLTQALVNLVINAIQATGPGGCIEVRVRADEPAAVLSIEVQDTGPGIPPDEASVIFDPYFTTKEEGYGLGLWIVQQIVTAHGGAVAAANATGGGAVFTMHLPLAPKKAAHG